MYKTNDNILNLFGFQQVNFIPTRITPTTKSALDHIIYNKDNKFSQHGVVTTGLSDHLITYCRYEEVNKTGF